MNDSADLVQQAIAHIEADLTMGNTIETKRIVWLLKMLKKYMEACKTYRVGI